MLERQLFPKNLNSFQKNKSIWANCYFALNFLQPKWIIPIIEYVYFFNLRALYNSEFLPAVPAHPPLRAGCWGDALGWSLRSLPACLIARATEVGLYWWLECRGADGMEAETFSPFSQLLRSGVLAPMSWDVPTPWELLFHLCDPMWWLPLMKFPLTRFINSKCQL